MIGSRAWMNTSNGKLSFKEKTRLIKQVLIPVTLNYGKTFLKAPHDSTLFTLDNFHIPDTAIAKEAMNELEQTASQAIINHSWRSYFWAVAIAHTKQWQFDQESLFVSCLMHDLGLVDHLDQYACQCFSFESALRAEALCTKHHYPKVKIDNISDAICLHMNGNLDENDPSLTKEALLLQKATSCDVIGTDLSLFSNSFKNKILTQYPRVHFNSEMRKLISIEAKRNPQSRTALMHKLGLSSMIQMNIFKD